MQHTPRLHLTLSLAILLMTAAATAQESSKADSPVQGTAINGSVLTEDSCQVLASTNGQKPELRDVPGLHALDRNESRPLALASTPDTRNIGVVCWRSEARLAPNDYLVPAKAGVSLYIKTDTGNEATDRTIALEKVNGSYRVRLLHGPAWTSAEQQEMIDAMTNFNKRVAGGS